MPEGVISGGWGFVIAAFAVTYVVLTVYAWSVWSRLRRAQSEVSE